MLALSRRVQVNDRWSITWKHPNYTEVINCKGVIWLVWFACPFLFLSNWEFQKFAFKGDHGFSGTWPGTGIGLPGYFLQIITVFFFFYKLLPITLNPAFFDIFVKSNHSKHLPWFYSLKTLKTIQNSQQLLSQTPNLLSHFCWSEILARSVRKSAEIKKKPKQGQPLCQL